VGEGGDDVSQWERLEYEMEGMSEDDGEVAERGTGSPDVGQFTVHKYVAPVQSKGHELMGEALDRVDDGRDDLDI
jgi:hypothetical protein